MAEHKKKAMNTNYNNNTGLRNRAEQLGARRPINFKRRWLNRRLNTQSLLELLQQQAPRFLSFAEIVGKWVWIRFEDRQPVEVTRVLAELGFHWNRTRQAWQHPCGSPSLEAATYDPRRKYGSRPATNA
jgi:hypothetical protein